MQTYYDVSLCNSCFVHSCETSHVLEKKKTLNRPQIRFQEMSKHPLDQNMPETIAKSVCTLETASSQHHGGISAS